MENLFFLWETKYQELAGQPRVWAAPQEPQKD